MRNAASQSDEPELEYLTRSYQFPVDAQERRPVKARLHRELLKHLRADENIDIAASTPIEILGIPLLEVNQENKYATRSVAPNNSLVLRPSPTARTSRMYWSGRRYGASMQLAAVRHPLDQPIIPELNK